jgi:hypothetical protein
MNLGEDIASLTAFNALHEITKRAAVIGVKL